MTVIRIAGFGLRGRERVDAESRRVLDGRRRRGRRHVMAVMVMMRGRRPEERVRIRHGSRPRGRRIVDSQVVSVAVVGAVVVDVGDGAGLRFAARRAPIGPGAVLAGQVIGCGGGGGVHVTHGGGGGGGCRVALELVAGSEGGRFLVQLARRRVAVVVERRVRRLLLPTAAIGHCFFFK